MFLILRRPHDLQRPCGMALDAVPAANRRKR